MKYMVFNKESDYMRGQMTNLSYNQTGLTLHNVISGKPGVFLSRMLDAREKETVWHRLVMESEIGDNMAVFLHIFATDSRKLADRIVSMKNESHHTVMEQLDQIASMNGIRKLSFRNPQDVLLHQLEGRFTWLGIIMWGNGSGSPRLHSIRMDFPRETWNSWLPELYQGKGQEFLERYLGIFQSLYLDMECGIRGNTRYLDLQAAEPEVLIWLAGWIRAEHVNLWTPERFRQYLSQGVGMYALRGTARGLVCLVELFTGETPYLMEAKKGEDPNQCRLMIKEEVISDLGACRAVERIIREGKPADMEVTLIPLKPYILLDQYTYLGINSLMNGYEEAVLNRDCALSFAVLGGER